MISDEYTTEYFRITSSTYVRRCFSLWMDKWWWTLAIPLSILLVMAIGDIRYLIVAFALALIVYPGIMALLYFNYALRPSAAYALLPHRIILSDKEIAIEYEPSDEYPVPIKQYIPFKSITRMENQGDYLILEIHTSIYDLLFIPISKIAAGDFMNVSGIISRAIEQTD